MFIQEVAIARIHAAALFDGFVPARRGAIEPDRTRPGIGVELKAADAEKYSI